MNREAMLKAAQQGQRLTIYLNGVEQKDILDADPDSGWIERAARNSYGAVIVDDGTVVRERRFGYVEVKAELCADRTERHSPNANRGGR